MRIAMTAVLTVVALGVTPVSSQAQQPFRAYFGATVGAHIERSDEVETAAPAFGLVVGVRLGPSWSLEGEVARPIHAFVNERTCQCYSFASTLADFDRLAVTEPLRGERRVTAIISAGAVYQPKVSPRWHARLFMGVSYHRVRESWSSTILAVPPGFTVTQAAATRPPSTAFSRNLGGLAVGGGVACSVAGRVAVAPEVRYVYGSFGDEINNAWQMSVKTTWSF